MDNVARSYERKGRKKGGREEVMEGGKECERRKKRGRQEGLKDVFSFSTLSLFVYLKRSHIDQADIKFTM